MGVFFGGGRKNITFFYPTPPEKNVRYFDPYLFFPDEVVRSIVALKLLKTPCCSARVCADCVPEGTKRWLEAGNPPEGSVIRCLACGMKRYRVHHVSDRAHCAFVGAFWLAVWAETASLSGEALAWLETANRTLLPGVLNGSDLLTAPRVRVSTAEDFGGPEWEWAREPLSPDPVPPPSAETPVGAGDCAESPSVGFPTFLGAGDCAELPSLGEIDFSTFLGAGDGAEFPSPGEIDFSLLQQL